MAYCKRCVCGHVNMYEQQGRAPLRCSACSRFIAAVVEELYEEPVQQETPKTEQEPRKDPDVPEVPEVPEQPKRFVITLESPDGAFSLPVTEEITVGRNAAGMDYLVRFADVSRTHFTIAPRFNGISATLTDISSQGTYVNGVRLVKGTPVAVSNSTVLRLANHAILILRVKEAGNHA